jgi:hypothetical protein
MTYTRTECAKLLRMLWLSLRRPSSISTSFTQACRDELIIVGNFQQDIIAEASSAVSGAMLCRVGHNYQRSPRRKLSR